MARRRWTRIFCLWWDLITLEHVLLPHPPQIIHVTGLYQNSCQQLPGQIIPRPQGDRDISAASHFPGDNLLPLPRFSPQKDCLYPKQCLLYQPRPWIFVHVKLLAPEQLINV